MSREYSFQITIYLITGQLTVTALLKMTFKVDNVMASEEEVDSIYDEYDSQEGKLGVIFLIDSRCSMFTKDYEEGGNRDQARINIALKCCRTELMNKIIAREKDLIGIVLFGTDKPDPKTNTKHVTLLLELNYPGAPAVKLLDKLLEDDSVEIQRTYGSSDDFLLADALWYCSSLFSNSGVNLHEKKIFLFTDDNNPHRSDLMSAHMTRKRAKDLNQLNISLEVLLMGTNIDYSFFYKELVEIIRGSQDTEELDPSRRLEELLERINRSAYRRRRYAKIKWNIGNLSLGVSLYTLYREASLLPKDPLYRATNEPVKRVKQTYNQATGELLLPSDCVDYISIVDSEIVISQEDKQALRKIMEPGLTLLGFKPLSLATESMHCGQSSFAYAEDTLVKGSKKLMKSLVKQSIARQKVALCCITPRHRAVTKYVYLVPSEETYDCDGHQLTPCGFHVIPLPFYNETRELTFERSLNVYRGQVEIAKKLIHKLKLTYKPNGFKNPKFQQFWAHLEALALDYNAPESIEDSTIPDTATQATRLGSLSGEFNNAFHLDGCRAAANKRESTSKQPSIFKRFRKDADTDVEQDIKNAIRIKKVDRFTVVQLREFLISHNQNVSNLKKKAELVDAVYKLKL